MYTGSDADGNDFSATITYNLHHAEISLEGDYAGRDDLDFTFRSCNEVSFFVTIKTRVQLLKNTNDFIKPKPFVRKLKEVPKVGLMTALQNT